jgi:dihydrofolate synthase/folylpolyglutamate synthase
MASAIKTSRGKSSKPAAKTKKTNSKAGIGKTLNKTSKLAPAFKPTAINTFTAAKAWLADRTDYEKQRVVRYDDKHFGLDRMRKLLDKLGNPQQQIKTVHVAGTKGKGSTCTMLASMLQGCGYTTGLYTSPHLIDIRERIALDGQIISQNDFADVVQRVAAAEAKLGFELTFFEAMTAAAFLYFAEQAVDIAVLETGLGGRLDATNVCEPLASAVTAISLDHTHILGESVEQIALEKAGIFKPGIPALTIEQPKPILEKLASVAEKAGTKLEVVGKDIDFSYRFESSRERGPHARVVLTTPRSKFEHFPVPLRGEHQAHNCGLALALLDRLKEHGFSFADELVMTGLEATTLPGRMEELWQQPRVIVDGAHNAASLTALIKSLGAHVQYDSLVMIFGCGQDKDVNGMLKQVGLGADKVIFTRAKSNARAMEPEDLIRRFAELSGKMAQTAPDLRAALKLAGSAVHRDDLILITGSFYLAGEARKLLLEAAKNRAQG